MLANVAIGVYKGPIRNLELTLEGYAAKQSERMAAVEPMVAGRLAEGDLGVRVDGESTDETGLLLLAMRNMVDRLSQTITEVPSGADALTLASAQVSSTSQSLSNAARGTAAPVLATPVHDDRDFRRF